jgi:hypothetical protein
MAAPEGSVTCPRRAPELAWGAAVCDTASGTHNCNDKIMSARQSAKERYLQRFIPMFPFLFFRSKA